MKSKIRSTFWLLFTISLITLAGMTWIARDFVYMNGKRFSILELQFPSAATLQCRLGALAANAKAAVTLQLWVDFFYMALIYPAIAVLCFWAGQVSLPGGQRMFFRLSAAAMLIPWAADIYENFQLLCWLNDATGIEEGIAVYRTCVWLKFGLAIAVLVVALSGINAGKNSKLLIANEQ